MSQASVTRETVGARFERDPNSLNFVRLVLALEVVLWHSYSLRGSTWLPENVETWLSSIAVDGFFAISGFLITRAWLRRRSAGAYYLRRARRILPGLLGCLLVTGLAIVPLANGGWSAPTWSPNWVPATWAMVGFAGPAAVPFSGVWNGSLWSLGYEEACYALVAIVGLLGLWRRGVAVGLAVASWAVLLMAMSAGAMEPGPVWQIPRCLLMFACGAALWFLADHVRLSRPGLAVCAVVVVASVALPIYQVAAAPALAYLCVGGGIWLGRYPRLVLRNDISYGVYIYGFPLQQLLIVAGFGGLAWAPFAALSLVLWSQPRGSRGC
jgi:peptidoglycan/LPS O-acetylase OafA/YrhL